MKTYELLGGKLSVMVEGKGGETRGSLYPLTPDDPDFCPHTEASCTAIEHLILAHACAGIQVDSAPYQEGLQTTLDAIDNAS